MRPSVANSVQIDPGGVKVSPIALKSTPTEPSLGQSVTNSDQIDPDGADRDRQTDKQINR